MDKKTIRTLYDEKDRYTELYIPAQREKLKREFGYYYNVILRRYIFNRKTRQNIKSLINLKKAHMNLWDKIENLNIS